MSEGVLRLEVNEDGQIVVSDRVGGIDMFAPVVFSRGDSLFIASAVMGRRVSDGTLDHSVSLGDMLRMLGAVETRIEQGDRTLIDRYEEP